MLYKEIHSEVHAFRYGFEDKPDWFKECHVIVLPNNKVSINGHKATLGWWVTFNPRTGLIDTWSNEEFVERYCKV